MRTSITVGYTHKQPDKCRIIFGPEIPMDRQRTELKKLLSQRSHPEFSCIEIYEQPVKSAEFLAPEVAKRQEAERQQALKKAEAEGAARKPAEGKARKPAGAGAPDQNKPAEAKTETPAAPEPPAQS